MTTITPDAATRISQLRASLAILKANPGMSIASDMALGWEDSPVSVHDGSANCFCFLGRVARDHCPSTIWDEDDVWVWFDNIFFTSLGGEMISGRFIALNDRAETKADRFRDIEAYIDLLEARFVRGEDVNVYT